MTNINNWPTNPEGKPLAFYGARKLGEVAKIVTGKLNANQAVRDGTYPFYTCADEILRINKTAFDGESILVAGNGDFWVKYHESGLFNAYQRTYVIQNEKDKEAITKYLYYSVSLQTPKFKKMAQGGIIKFLHLEQLQNLKIPIPPLKIQKQIVERLDKIAEAQELNDKQIKLAEELYRSLLHSELNSKFKNQKSKLQVKIKKLREVIIINYGKGLPKSERKEAGKYFAYGSNGPVYKTNEILVNFPTIIIGRKGAAGALYLVKEPSWPIDTTFYVEIKDKNGLNLDFLYFLLQTMNLQYLAIVTAVPGINRDNLYNLKIPLPLIEIQQKIVEKLSAVQDYKKKLLEQKQKLQELFDSVLNKSMTPAPERSSVRGKKEN